MCGTFAAQLWSIGDVAAGVHLDPRRVEAEPLGVRDRADGEQRVRAARRPGRRRSGPRRRSSVALDARSARAPLSSLTPRSRKSSSSTAATSGSFCGSTCWRLTTSVTLAPNDENMWTNSTPVTPEPITMRCVGKLLAAGSSRGWSGRGRRRAGTSRGCAAGCRSTSRRRRRPRQAPRVAGRRVDHDRRAARRSGPCRG